MNNPIFVINGKERREVKKELAKLKRFIKVYWHYRDIDEVYGSSLVARPIKESIIFLAEKQTEINELERKISERL